MDRKTAILIAVTALVTSVVTGGVQVATAQEPAVAAPHGVQCATASSTGKAEQWIGEQLAAGRTHVLLGGTSAFILCAY